MPEAIGQNYSSGVWVCEVAQEVNVSKKGRET